MIEKTKDDLIEWVAKQRHNPLEFCKHAYGWGEGELKSSSGPRKWQAERLRIITEHLQNPKTRHQPLRMAVASGHGIGKVVSNIICLDTPSGFKKWGDIEVGDYVFGSDGNPTKVIKKYPHKNWNFYKITFSDGTFTYAGLEHKWEVTTKADRDRNKGARIVTTEEMMNNLRRGYQIPLTEPVNYPHKQGYLHPYIMGYLLGNGSMRTPSAIRVSCHDVDLYDYMQTLLPEETKFSGKWNKNYLHIASFGGQNADNKILNELELLGVHGKLGIEKFIPDFFKYNSVESRIQLLRGLMDSDGTISPRKGDNGRLGYKVQFSTSSEKLRDDIIWLVRSLGGVANYSVDRRRGMHGLVQSNHDNFEIHVNLPNHINPFHLKRKNELYNDYVETVKRKTIKAVNSIEFEHVGDGHCIEVDAENHLYLCNDFIVTHNSSLISMICNWAMSTCVDTKVVVTANTETQLRTKTWPEICKWFSLSITKDWFSLNATSINAKSEGKERSWHADAIPWSDNNTEGFAGLHNEGKRIVLIMDEASAIADKVFEVAQGAMTDENTEILWIVFGNPTRNTGYFRDCFDKYSKYWKTAQIDSRTVEGTNKKYFDEMIEQYGEDSDVVRIRIKGEFPRAGSMQFIPSDIVETARKKAPEAFLDDECVIGVDVARFGDDESCIVVRRGKDAKSVDWVKFKGVDTMTLAGRVAEMYRVHKPDCIFVDGGGVGGGVVDRLRMLKMPVMEVQFGSAADGNSNTDLGIMNYFNKRAEIWGRMREWLGRGGAIPDRDDLARQLTSVEYSYRTKGNADCIILERKEDMKKRGLPSPDAADALAVTFSFNVVPSNHAKDFSKEKSQHSINYNPLSYEKASANSSNKSHQTEWEWDPYA